MAAGGGTQQTLRRALKDTTKVGLAQVDSENKGLDVAIDKAANHDEVLAKEKQIKTIFNALSSSSPRPDVAYCIHSLTKRLAKAHNWTVALKTLIVIHCALKEVHPSFHEELINFGQRRSLMLNLSHFKDDLSPNVRTYALYLEEFLECYRILRNGIEKDHSKTRELDPQTCLSSCLPCNSYFFAFLPAGQRGQLIRYALSIAAGESVKLYVAITDGIRNLVDRGLNFGQGLKFLNMEKPAASFITSMEEYVTEAPCVLALPCTAV